MEDQSLACGFSPLDGAPAPSATRAFTTTFTLQSVTVSTVTTVGSEQTVDVSGAKLVHVRAVGGGGGGGGWGNDYDAGGGGGGGGYAEVYLTDGDLGANTQLKVTVGDRGARVWGSGNESLDGGDGGTTTVKLADNTVVCTCTGGVGGGAGNGHAPGGAGGTASITTGQGWTSSGTPGQNGRDSGTTITNHGGGRGGDSRMGAGGVGASERQVSGVQTPGGDGEHGGGGGGGMNDDSTTYMHNVTVGALPSGYGGYGLVVVVAFK